MKRRNASPLGLALFAFALGCQKAAPPPSAFDVRFEVKNEQALGISGAIVQLEEREVGTTDPDGVLGITLPGTSPEINKVTVVCPAGYFVPETLPPLKLTRVRDLRDGGRFRATSYLAHCERTTRDLVIAVHAKGAPALPVSIQGKTVGRTDANGIGHFLVSAAPGTEFEVELDTKAAPKLRPQTPSRSFVIGRVDDVVMFAPQFSAVVPKRIARKPPPKENPRPTAAR